MLEFTEKLSTRAEIYTFLCKHGKSLRSDGDFTDEIILKHLDESEFHLLNCTWDECEEKVYIWTEHCGYFYFYKEDIENMEVITWKLIKDDWKITERKNMTFSMEVKPNGKEQSSETGIDH